jgi:hypothetical protein
MISLQSAPLTAALVSVFVTVLIGGSLTVIRFVFGVELLTTRDIEKRDAEIMDTLDDHTERLEEIETLIMGGEYQISDGMLEVVHDTSDDVDDHEKRIEGIERIQLKIRRRQQGDDEPIARGEDIDPPPAMDTDLHKDE